MISFTLEDLFFIAIESLQNMLSIVFNTKKVAKHAR